MPKLSYVLDTNVWVSAIITKTDNQLHSYIVDNNIKVFISPEMILELEDVLSRAKFKKYIQKPISDYIQWISKLCTSVNSETHYNEAPDKDDNYLYDICIATKSKLVTGDKALLAHISKPPVTTISRVAFFKIY